MKNKVFKKEIFPVRLRLELKEEYLTDYQRTMLKRYGESISGDSISRDILIPSDMPLHNLHYTIQRLFGWQNSHLRRFYLPEEIHKELTGGMAKGWAQLVGVLFQPPSMGEEDLFWDDDYERGSINTWLRRKYTGPYIYGGLMEDYEAAQRDLEELIENLPVIEVYEFFSNFLKRKEKDPDAQMEVIKRAPLMDLTIEEVDLTVPMTVRTGDLMERLEVNKVLAAQDEDLGGDELFPLTRELFYNYDFGDNWIIKITKYKDCDDLLEKNLIYEGELMDAIGIVMDQHKPVCINKEGLFVMDDVGGLPGFTDFLGIIYEGEDKDQATHLRAWARNYGWSARKVYCQKIL